MAYKCNKCETTFAYRSKFFRHQQRVTPCAYKCERCNNICKTKNEYRYHTCGNSTSLAEHECEFCFKNFTSKFNKKRHVKICTVKQKNSEALIKKLEEENKRLKSQLSTTTAGCTQIINNIHVDVNNPQINVMINVFGNENLEKLDKTYIAGLLKRNLPDILPLMVQHIHANPALPENHNVYYDKEGKKMLTKAGSPDSWVERETDEVIDTLVQRVQSYFQKQGTELRQIECNQESENNFMTIVTNQMDYRDPSEDTINQTKEVLSDPIIKEKIVPKDYS